MFGRLDRYVGKVVLGSYLATLVFIGFLWVVVDLLLNMTRYHRLATEKDFGLWDILTLWAQFHTVSMPWIFVMLAPFVSVIGCMFAISRLMSSNEVTPMVFTGRSTARVLRPCLLIGVFSAVTMVGIWEVLLPATSRSMQKLDGLLNEGRESGEIESVLLFSPDRRARLMVDSYQPELQRMTQVVAMDFGESEEDLSEIRATTALWDAERQDWELQNGEFVQGEFREARDWLGMKGVTPEMLWLSARDTKSSAVLSYSETLELIDMSPQRHDLVIAMHYHITWPLANLVLLMLAMPFAVHFERGSKIGRVVLAISICAGYLVVDLTCQNLGRQEFIHPVLAAWTPTILFGSLGAVMFGGMRT